MSPAAALFMPDAPLRLVGGRAKGDGRIVFPHPGTDDFEAVALSPTGTLWSYTIQRFRPKTPPYAGPEEFTPWALGYVDLPGEVIVQARLVNVAFADIRIGMPLALTKVALDAAADDPLWLPAFAPLEQAA
ncbi:Zn-ribbon domain-containing OB-fold protein [Novosphingobium pokkalii]|uniref:Zn-ribbon domain-containing OB-fold protein n=1 Tax=Novosphingobium pokkalii TaxID=1770194 RepID=A0ABV7V3U1_9SPHN|nr:OB-fold domain-containing protein [Novosphingobium pokkalii]GHC89777.1 hypothetical protein GCM10019060_13590 [Novosphingobium pokkalii]